MGTTVYPTKHTAWKLGYEAYQRRADYQSNPYRQLAFNRAWRQGWLAAEQDEHIKANRKPAHATDGA